LIALADGYRESEQSWAALLLDCQARGLTTAPLLATGDGALGFWMALRKLFPATKEQRCWVHKTANLLDKMAKGQQPQAKAMLHDIWQAATKAETEEAFDLFVATCRAKYGKAAECLAKDREELLAFYDFLAEHWVHLRTTNPIESTFATARLRTAKTKGSGSRSACLTMEFKLINAAAKRWRLLNGSPLLSKGVAGVRFVDGVEQTAA
jgi:putative transposase